jgi:hypothetical protein
MLDGMGNWIAIPMQLTLGLVIALLSGKHKRLAVALSLLSFFPPFISDPDQHRVRFICALGAITNIFRALDLYRDRRTWHVGRRIWLLWSIFDSRDARFGKPTFHKEAWAKSTLFGALSALAIWGLVHFEPVDQRGWALRWLFGALYVYLSFGLFEAFFRAGYLAVGITVPRFHFHPILARSLNDFWGRRWNMIIHDLLSRHCFRPLVRRKHGQLGIAFAFFMSTAAHFWITFAVLDLWWAGLMSLYFIIQGVIMMLERPLRVPRWPRALSHVWTILWVAGPSPLLVEPLIRILLSSVVTTP